jgi:hypothetical protein
VGTKISRIEKEFILAKVADNEIEVRLTGDKREAKGVLGSVEEDCLYVSLTRSDPDAFSIGTEVIAYFSYFGHVMTFDSTVRGNDDGVLRLDLPDHMFRNLSRKYARVRPPTDASVSFAVHETRVRLNFPRSEEYRAVEAPIVEEGLDLKNIQKLIEWFREKTADVASVNRIVMFRDKPPKAFEERMISQSGRILYIPDTAARLPEAGSSTAGRIINRAMLLQAGMGDEGKDRMPSLLAEKRSKGILAEIYCPILFHEYVVGYIYLAQDRQMERKFDEDLLEETDEFAKVLAYSLKINDYIKGAPSETNTYQGEIIDISAAGLLFANPSDQLKDQLALYADLDLLLAIGQRKIRVVSRVMRKFVNDNVTFFGLQFMEMKPEDFRFLFEYVYGRPMRGEDEELWEGGSEPPRLDL